MRKSAAPVLAVLPAILGGCVISALWEPYAGVTNPVECQTEAKVAAIGWTDGREGPACILFLEDVRPGHQSELAPLWAALPGSAVVLRVEIPSQESPEGPSMPCFLASSCPPTPLESVSADITFKGKPENGLYPCTGEVVIHAQETESVLRVLSLRLRGRDEVQDSVPVVWAAADARGVRFRESVGVPEPVPWYVVALTPLALAADVTLLTVTGLLRAGASTGR